ncbi:MAG TPA: hypothetical protein VKD90_16875 [Gemmataceae bacterium]|nr:hypothetical protein [Gemmataceae bacterium]
MPHLGIEAATGLTVAAPLAVAAVAVTDPAAALDILPVSAGLSGSIVAGLKTHLRPGGAPPAGRWQWLPTVVSGAAAAVFAGPALAELVGWRELRSLILMHFLIGLLGSTLCDEVLTRSRALSRLFVGRWADALVPGRSTGDRP